MVYIASLLGAQHLREVVENKLASLLVVSLGKALNGTPHLYMEDVENIVMHCFPVNGG